MRIATFSLSQLLSWCFVSLLFAPTLSIAQSSSSQLVANGFATYQELGQKVFIAALYLESPTKDLSSMHAMTNKRLEMKVVAKKLSYRRLGRFFIKAAAINNRTQLLIDNAQAMEQFLGQFHDNFAQGDHIVLAGVDDGFELLVNDVLLTKIESPALMNMLLNAWIGNVPPSRDFKSHLLGNESSLSQASEFLALSYSPYRVEEIKTWNSEEVLVAEEAEATPPAAEKAEPAVPASNKSENKKPTLQTASLTRATKVVNKPVAKSTSVTPAVVENVENVAKPVVTEKVTQKAVAQEPNVKKTSTQNTVVEKPQVAAAQPKNTQKTNIETTKIALAKSTLEDKKESVLDSEFTAENLLATQLYTSKLLLHSQRRMVYPPVSVRLNQTGTVIANVTINRKGKLLEYELTELSEHKRLNTAVKKGIKRSSPYPQIPDHVEGEAFSFLLPVVFQQTEN